MEYHLYIYIHDVYIGRREAESSDQGLSRETWRRFEVILIGMSWNLRISMSYGAWNGPEGRAAGVPPQFRNFSFRPGGALLFASWHLL